MLRGPFLNPWDAQTWYPLIERGHDVKFIGAKNLNFFDISRIPNVILTNFVKINKTYVSLDLQKFLKNFDIVHSVETYHLFTLQCAIFKNIFGYKLFITQWENIAYPDSSIAGNIIRRNVKTRVDKIIAVTKKSKDVLLEESTDENKIEILPPGIDLNIFKPNKSSLRDNFDDEVIVLFIGRLVEEKGVRDLLDAMQKIWQKVQSVRLIICGNGPLRSLVLSYIKQGYPITYYSSYPYPEVNMLYNACDIFILPSKATKGWEEQFGMVLIEAMACRKPVITTKSGSIPYVVGKCAYLVNPGSVPEIGKALLELIDNEALRKKMGKSSRKFVEKKYDNRIIAKKLLKIYNSKY